MASSKSGNGAPGTARGQVHTRTVRGHDIIAMGGSAGGLDAMFRVIGALPADLSASVFLVLHIPAHRPSLLPTILQKRSRLPVRTAADGARIEKGSLYIAPPDCHLLVDAKRIRVVHGPKENRHRPAVDPLFRSAAWAHGPHVVGVILSGTLSDGAAGLWAVKSLGGVTIVQEPHDAEYPDMPLAALSNLKVDHRVPVDQIAPLLVDYAQRAVEAARTADVEPRIALENRFATLDGKIDDMAALGNPSHYTCPTCHGVLWEIKEGDDPRYRCHVGHAFSAESLVTEQSKGIEDALGSALRALEQKAAAVRNLADRMMDRHGRLGEKYEADARDIDAQAKVIRDLLLGRTTSSKDKAHRAAKKKTKEEE